jgi:SAM-dependent methyltransferase
VKRTPPSIDWSSYVDRYHADRPGITEDVLSSAADDAGRTPYDWLLEPVRPVHGLVLDLGCGSAPLARRPRGTAKYLGVDRSEPELRRARAAAPAVAVARADACALPVADGRADAVVASMMLMVVADVDAVLAEVARALRPGGTFVATVPTRPSDDDPSADLFAEVLTALGQAQVRYPGSLNPSGLAARGLELTEDAPGRFTRSVTGEQCRLVVDSFYAVGAGEDQLAEAYGRLQARAAAGPFPLTYPLRRLVAVRSRPTTA